MYIVMSRVDVYVILYSIQSEQTCYSHIYYILQGRIYKCFYDIGGAVWLQKNINYLKLRNSCNSKNRMINELL